MRRALGGVVLMVVIAGCGGSSHKVKTLPAQAPPAGPKKEQLVVVHESEFKLDPASASAGPAGPVKIRIVNDGRLHHALAVKGPEGLVELDGDVAPGQTGVLEVDLDRPGTYEMYCPLDHHREQGMAGTITVGGSAPARGTDTNSTTTQTTTQTVPTPTQTQTQTHTQTQTQTETKTVTTPTQTSTSPTATSGSPSSGGSGY